MKNFVSNDFHFAVFENKCSIFIKFNFRLTIQTKHFALSSLYNFWFQKCLTLRTLQLDDAHVTLYGFPLPIKCINLFLKCTFPMVYKLGTQLSEWDMNLKDLTQTSHTFKYVTFNSIRICKFAYKTLIGFLFKICKGGKFSTLFVRLWSKYYIF